MWQTALRVPHTSTKRAQARRFSSNDTTCRSTLLRPSQCSLCLADLTTLWSLSRLFVLYMYRRMVIRAQSKSHSDELVLPPSEVPTHPPVDHVMTSFKSGNCYRKLDAATVEWGKAVRARLGEPTQKWDKLPEALVLCVLKMCNFTRVRLQQWAYSARKQPWHPQATNRRLRKPSETLET